MDEKKERAAAMGEVDSDAEREHTLRRQLDEMRLRMRYRGSLTPAERAALGTRGLKQWQEREAAKRSAGLAGGNAGSNAELAGGNS